MNWDIKEIHNYNEYMQKYSIHSLLAKIFAQREYNEQDVQGHTSKRLIYHDFSLFLDADLVLDRIQEALENDEKICGIKDFKSRKYGSVAYIDMSIFIDNNKTLEEAHNIADNLENDIISKLSYIKEINIHTEPYKG